MNKLPATEIEETEDNIKFKIGKRPIELSKGFPKVIQIETSSYCNLVCLGCPQKDITRKKGFMQPDLFKKIVDELSNYDVRVWLHYMGEPLMHPQIFELIDYASNKLPYCGMSTNGILLSLENAEKILASNLFRFEISIDSLDPETFRRLRPGGNPENIIKNAHEFFRMKYTGNQERPITCINVRRLTGTQHELKEFAEYWKKILIPPDFVLSFPFEKWGGHESDEHATYTVPEERVPCLKLWNKVNILSDGRVATCDAMFDGQVTMGDMNTSSLREIWDSSDYYDRRQMHLDGKTEEMKICNVCDSWYREVGPEYFQNMTYEYKCAG